MTEFDKTMGKYVGANEPPTTWTHVSDDTSSPKLAPGIDPNVNNVLPGEELVTKIENMTHYDAVFQNKYTGRGTCLTLFVQSAKQNKSLEGGTYAFFVSGEKRRENFLRTKPGIGDWFKIDYIGRDTAKGGNMPHIYKFMCSKVPGSYFIEDDCPMGSEGQGYLLEQEKKAKAQGTAVGMGPQQQMALPQQQAPQVQQHEHQRVQQQFQQEVKQQAPGVHQQAPMAPQVSPTAPVAYPAIRSPR